jgi:hypothetical protein
MAFDLANLLAGNCQRDAKPRDGRTDTRTMEYCDSKEKENENLCQMELTRKTSVLLC